jgi:hypothetical protein
MNADLKNSGAFLHFCVVTSKIVRLTRSVLGIKRVTFYVQINV